MIITTINSMIIYKH